MLFLMLCKSMLTHEVMVLWWKSVFHVSYVFYGFYVFESFSYGLCDVDLMLYPLIESRHMRDVLYWRIEGYVSWVMLYVFWVMLCQSNEWIGEDYVCVLLKNGNREEAKWGLIGGKHGVIWLSSLTLNLLYNFNLLLLLMRLTNPLYMRW